MSVTIYEPNVGHIFRNEEGHLYPDNEQNRKLLISVVSDPSNALGSDRFDNHWYAKIQKDGSQLWAQVRNNQIRNGGINASPRNFKPQSGLSGVEEIKWND